LFNRPVHDRGGNLYRSADFYFPSCGAETKTDVRGDPAKSQTWDMVGVPLTLCIQLLTYT
jgi:hypothetical protein